MIKDQWAQILDRYRDYVRRFPDESFISGPDDGSGLLLRDSIMYGRGNIYEALEGPLERECLLSHNPDLPQIESLPLNILEKLPIGLTHILQAQISRDHRRYWELTYRIVEGLDRTHDFIEPHLRRTIQPVFNLTLVDVSKSIPGRLDDLSAPSHESQIIENSRYIAAFASYPALEGYLKSRSGGVVSSDGTVTQEDEIWNQRTGTCYSKGDRCNRLTDLLTYFENEQASGRLARELEELRIEISNFGNVGRDEAYGLIYSWRNSSLHGEGEADVQYGIILNLLSLFIWYEINQRVTMESN